MQNAGVQLSGKGAKKALPEAKADPVATLAVQLQALTGEQRTQLAAILGGSVKSPSAHKG